MAGNRIKVWTTGLLALVLAVVLSACGANGKNAENKGDQASQQPGQTATAQEPPGKTVYPLTIKDATGQEFTFKKRRTKSFPSLRLKPRRCSPSDWIRKLSVYRTIRITRKQLRRSPKWAA